jgi:TolB-like protein
VQNSAVSSLTGRRVGVFDIQEPIGAGGMGEVYRARDTRLDRDVTIKILPETRAADPERIVRFEREARVLASLNHPNIATVHGVEESTGLGPSEPHVRALVMELVDGVTLTEFLRAKGQPGLPVDEAAEIARQIATALEAAHQKGVVHRDLKPANIMRRPDGLVKVLDFGLAKAFESDPSERADSSTMTGMGTRAGVVMGTTPYMSPEQARGLPVDTRTDIWSFGCVFYEMLAGRPAFDGRTTSDIIVSVLEHEPDWSRLPKDTPASARRVLRRCFEKDPKRRLRDIGEARIELEQAVAPFRARRSLAALLSAAVLLATIGIAAALWIRKDRPGAGSAPRSLAVLPFRALSDADEYLGHGITADVITKVSQIRELTVRPRSAVLKYSGASGSALDAGRELGVDAVVEGTLQRQDRRVRVNVSLVAVQSGASIWSATMDVDSDSTFEIQDRLSQEIAARLRLTLTPQETARLAKQYTTNARAYELYVQGMQAFERRGILLGDKAIEAAMMLFQQAVAVDQTYALAQVQLAYCYAWKALFNEPSNPRWIQLARDGLAKAQALDSDLPEAHIVAHEIAWSRYGGFDIEKAIRELRAARELDPTVPLLALGNLYAHLGLAPQSNQAMERAYQIDPFGTAVRNRMIEMHVLLGQNAEAVAATERFKQHAITNRLSMALLAQKDYRGARRLLDAATPAERADPFYLSARALFTVVTGSPGPPDDDLRRAIELSEGTRAFHHTAYNVACIRALRREPATAVEWLRKTADTGMPNYPLFARDPFLDNIRREPAFVAFMEELQPRWKRLSLEFQ